MLVTRLNQIGAGGSGVDPAVLDVLADALNRGFTPPVPLYGAIGTGDLTALASTGLCLIGERAWRTGTGPPPRFPLRPAEAPGFMSSNAATLGEAALACHDLGGLVELGGGDRGPVAARGARLAGALRPGGAPGPPGRAAAGGQPDAGPAGRRRAAARARRPGSRTPTATGPSRRCTARRRTRWSTPRRW